MKILIRLMVFFAVVFFIPSSINASENPRLYKKYVFGEKRKKITKQIKTYDCSSLFESGAICKDDERLFGVNYTIAFRFTNNILVSVALVTKFDLTTHLKTIQQFSKTFTPIAIKDSTGKIFDITKNTKKFNRGKFAVKFNRFEQMAMASGDVTYVFLEKAKTAKIMRRSRNYLAAIKNSPKDVRELDYLITSIDNVEYTIISFTTPLFFLDYVKSLSQKKGESEKF